MDKKSIIKISNAYFKSTLNLKEVNSLIKEYCIEKGKSDVAGYVSDYLTRNGVFQVIGKNIFEYVLKHYQTKYGIILLSSKVPLEAYANPDFINRNYILAY